ncbi:MAG: hypothetical protein HOI95_14400 [Chromatiales bacterium]|jgi:serine/threonine protein kinase|nr:hypothetical protein [Chromatiales bacterium]
MQYDEQGLEQALPKGTLLDAYEIHGVLGVGGFGITYAAEDRSLERRVAIKEYFPATLAIRGKDGSNLLARSRSDVDSYEWGLTRFLTEIQTA